MAVKRPRFEVGLTLIKITVSTIVLLTAVLGVSLSLYNPVLCACEPDLQVAAVHTNPRGSMFCRVISNSGANILLRLPADSIIEQAIM